MSNKDDTSADEEFRQRRTIRRKLKKVKEPAQPIECPMSLSACAPASSVATPSVFPIENFVRDFAHTEIPAGHQRPPCDRAEAYVASSSSSSSSASASSATPFSSLDGIDIEALSKSNPEAILGIVEQARLRGLEEQFKAWTTQPARQRIFQDIRDQLYSPMFFTPDMAMASSASASASPSSMKQEESRVSTYLEQALRKGIIRHIVLPCDVESELLAESGRFKHVNNNVYDFPPCMRGSDCVGMTLDFPGMHATENLTYDAEEKKYTSGFVFTQLMFPDEYADFIQNQIQPQNQRPCVACCRHLATMAVLAIRSCNASVSPGMNAIPEIQMFLNREVIQLYRNLVDQVGGYYSENSLIPRAQGDEPIVNPICMLNLSSVKVRRLSNSGLTPGGNRRYLDQSLLVYRPPQLPTPGIGQSLQSFIRGAGR
jgi:hypothetical protein